MLDFDFSTEYYLRVLELVIRDRRRTLIYDARIKQLVAFPYYQDLVSTQTKEKEYLKIALKELLKHDPRALSAFVYLVDVIDRRELEEKEYIAGWLSFLFPAEVAVRRATLEKLSFLRTLLLEEIQEAQDKVGKSAAEVLAKVQESCSVPKLSDVSISFRETKGKLELQKMLERSSIFSNLSQALMKYLVLFLEAEKPVYQEIGSLLLRDSLATRSSPVLVDEAYLSQSDLCKQLVSLDKFSSKDFERLTRELVFSHIFRLPVDWKALRAVWQTNQGRGVSAEWELVSQASPDIYQNSQLVLSKVFLEILLEKKESSEDVRQAAFTQLVALKRFQKHHGGVWLWIVREAMDCWVTDHRKEILYKLQRRVERLTKGRKLFARVRDWVKMAGGKIKRD